jgi:lipopolysaccharide/colanic/teichoic acid biosynthesis glycosyltransferase
MEAVGPGSGMHRARSPDVEQAAARLRRPRVRAALAAKRALDVLLAVAMLVALLPVFLLVGVLLAGAGEPRWLERKVRLGRGGEPVPLLRFPALPGGLGRALERLGARELPLLLCVITGRLSFVGPRPLPPGTGAGHAGPRRLMAPGLIGPAQRRGEDGHGDGELDDAYVADWTLRGDLRMLVFPRRHAPRPVSTGD